MQNRKYKQHKNYLSKFDFFGYQLQFNITSDQSQFRTNYGGCITIMILTLLLSYFIKLSVDLIIDHSPNTILNWESFSKETFIDGQLIKNELSMKNDDFMIMV